MYHVIKPNLNSSHGLNEYLSRRGESTLESFHLALAHFGNMGMRDSLADNLNLTGTARHNITIRYKLRLAEREEQRRSKIPAAWEGIVPFYNHSKLDFVNLLATKLGLSTQQLPFSDVEKLPLEDTGERFFSEYLAWLSVTEPPVNPKTDMCLCTRCANPASVPVC